MGWDVVRHCPEVCCWELMPIKAPGISFKGRPASSTAKFSWGA